MTYLGDGNGRTQGLVYECRSEFFVPNVSLSEGYDPHFRFITTVSYYTHLW